MLYAQHASLSEREAVASACIRDLALTIPVLVDDMANSADQVYRGWPERIYVLNKNGKVSYQGGKGPYGFDLEELDRFLAGPESGAQSSSG